MTPKYKLLCTHEDWHSLAKAVDKKGETTKVNREALDRLMKDHSRFIDYNKPSLEGDL